MLELISNNKNELLSFLFTFYLTIFPCSSINEQIGSFNVVSEKHQSATNATTINLVVGTTKWSNTNTNTTTAISSTTARIYPWSTTQRWMESPDNGTKISITTFIPSTNMSNSAGQIQTSPIPLTPRLLHNEEFENQDHKEDRRKTMNFPSQLQVAEQLHRKAQMGENALFNQESNTTLQSKIAFSPPSSFKNFTTYRGGVELATTFATTQPSILQTQSPIYNVTQNGMQLTQLQNVLIDVIAPENSTKKGLNDGVTVQTFGTNATSDEQLATWQHFANANSTTQVVSSNRSILEKMNIFPTNNTQEEKKLPNFPLPSQLQNQKLDNFTPINETSGPVLQNEIITQQANASQEHGNIPILEDAKKQQLGQKAIDENIVSKWNQGSNQSLPTNTSADGARRDDNNGSINITMKATTSDRNNLGVNASSIEESLTSKTEIHQINKTTTTFKEHGKNDQGNQTFLIQKTHEEKMKEKRILEASGTTNTTLPTTKITRHQTNKGEHGADPFGPDQNILELTTSTVERNNESMNNPEGKSDGHGKNITRIAESGSLLSHEQMLIQNNMTLQMQRNETVDNKTNIASEKSGQIHDKQQMPSSLSFPEKQTSFQPNGNSTTQVLPDQEGHFIKGNGTSQGILAGNQTAISSQNEQRLNQSGPVTPSSSQLGAIQGGILSISTTTTITITTSSPITTTTQDPIIKKELEKAGAPEILKQLVPPKPEPIPEPAKQIIEDKCAGGKCLEQKPEFKEQRIVVVKQEQAVEQKLNPDKPIAQVQKEVEQRVSKTFQLKKELLKSAGLEGKVEPANNGVFQADLLLTEEQANALILELERQRIQKSREKRAGNAVFMENSPTQRWPLNTPIPYMFDQSLVDKDRQAVRMALAEIQSKTCLKFIEARSKPTGSHLYYTKIANPTFCGLSYVGRIEPANPIYLSFMCGNESGIAIHETLHALGFQHEQLRFDRDQFITIQWENVNPQQLDFFAISDVTKFSSYGLRYDYGSVMHYSGTIAASNPGKKTMTAKLAPFLNDPLMGQRKGLSTSDAEALNKMYCSPGCEDKLVYCGIWATLNLCNPQMWRRGVTHAWIVGNCQKSCNKCGEKLEPFGNRPF